MFISCAASTANGFRKWSAAHPDVKYAPKSTKPAPIAPVVPDTNSPYADSARSSRPMTGFKLTAVHMRRAAQLRETAEGAAVGSHLRARLLDLALQYDRMAASSRHGSPEARPMRDE